MSRREFMERLAWLLQDIPDEERKAALDYYEGYFEEAGEGQEEWVISRLGSPEKVASEIKSGLFESASYREGQSAGTFEKRQETGEYTETGYEDTRYREAPQSVQRWKGSQEHEERRSGKFRHWWDGQSSFMRFVWMAIFLMVVFSGTGKIIHIVFGLAGGVFGLIGRIFGLVFGLVGGLLGLTAGAYGASVGLIGTGIAKFFVSPATGLLYCGVGCFGLAIGILLTFLCIWVCASLLPAIVRWIVKVFKGIFRGRREAD